MAEHDLYAKIVNGANKEGWALYRLPDAPGLPERPADIGGFTPHGRGVLIEVKEVRKYTGVGKLTFENSQIRWLRACDRRGGLALVVVKEEEGGDWLAIRVTGQETVDGPGILTAASVAYVLQTRGQEVFSWNRLLTCLAEAAAGEREWKGPRERL